MKGGAVPTKTQTCQVPSAASARGSSSNNIDMLKGSFFRTNDYETIPTFQVTSWNPRAGGNHDAGFGIVRPCWSDRHTRGGRWDANHRDRRNWVALVSWWC